MLDKIFVQLKEICGLNSASRKDLIDFAVKDYEDLINLKSRVGDGFIFEEDNITLDIILDYMEIFIKIIKGEM